MLRDVADADGSDCCAVCYGSVGLREGELGSCEERAAGSVWRWTVYGPAVISVDALVERIGSGGRAPCTLRERQPSSLGGLTCGGHEDVVCGSLCRSASDRGRNAAPPDGPGCEGKGLPQWPRAVVGVVGGVGWRCGRGNAPLSLPFHCVGARRARLLLSPHRKGQVRRLPPSCHPGTGHCGAKSVAELAGFWQGAGPESRHPDAALSDQS